MWDFLKFRINILWEGYFIIAKACLCELVGDHLINLDLRWLIFEVSYSSNTNFTC